MGLSIRRIGKKLTDLGSRAYDQANIFDNGLSAQTRQINPNVAPKSVIQQAAPIAQSFVRPVAQTFNTAAAQVPQVYYTLKGDTKMANIANQNFGKTGGLFNAGTFYDAQEAARGDLRTGLTNIGGGTLQTAATVAPFTKGGSVAVGLGKGSIKKAVPKLAAEGAGYGAAFSMGQQLQDTGKVNPKQLVRDTAIGVAGNVAVPVALRGAKTVVQAQKPLNEVGAIGDLKPKVANKVSQAMSQAAEAERTRYQKNPVVKLKDKAGATYDPFSTLVKIDKAYAKSKGMKYRDLPAKDRLDYLADTSTYSARQADQLIQTPTRTGESVAQVIQRYGEGTPAGKEFNNYLNSRFALEVAQKRGKNIIPGQSPEALDQFVKNYELRNPRAVVDATTIKAHADTLLDEAVNGGLISKSDAQFVKDYYQNYTPLSRVFSENLQRPEIGGKSVGSIGRQRVLQNLEGGNLPLDDSFSTIVSRTNTAVSQANKARLAKAYLDRAQGGVAPGDLLVGAGNKAARKDIRSDIRTVNKSTENLRKKVSITNRQARRIQSALDKLNKKGVELSTKQDRPVVLGKLADPGAIMSKGEFKNLLDNLVNETPANVRQVQKSIAVREPKLAAKLDDILSYKSSIGENKTLKTELKSNIAQLQDDPTTGKQVISGLVDGEPFKLEVPPEIATVLQGLDARKFDAVTQGFGKAMKVFQTAWTGFLNPVFSGVSFAFYDTPMSIINSRVGFKTLGARAIGESFKSLNGNSQFQQQLAKSGAQLVGGSQLGINAVKSAEAIAARKNIFSKIKFNATNPAEALQSLDVLGGKLANATRTRIAKATELDALKRGLSPEDALKEASYAYNNVLPNYGRASHLIKGINAYVPYASASVAGTRAMASALRNNPAATAKLLTVGIAPMVGATAYTLSSDEGQNFVNDMIASGKGYTLDNNFVIVLPGAEKDSKTGAWTGVLKLPVPPELRALNKIAWRQTNDFANGQNKNNAKTVASGLFDFMTGGLRTSENPLVQTTEILANKDPRSGLLSDKKLVTGDLADEPKSEQVYSSTSENAKRISNLVGNAISPIQADSILGQFSTAGQLLQNRDGTPAKTLKGSVERRFTGAYGEKDSSKYFKELDNITSGIEDKRSKAFFTGLHKKSDAESLLNSATKAGIYLSRPDVYEAEKKLEQFNRKQGKPANPLFDLTPEQTQKVLTYRSGKIYNSAGQNKDKNGESAFTALGLDEKWYDNFQKKESAFYDKVASSSGGEESRTFSGAVKPKASPELQKKMDYYYTLGKGTGQRSAFLKANPDVLDFWAKSNDFTEDERLALGFRPISEEDTSKYGFGTSKDSQYGSLDPYKYAVSIKAGGSIAKPKISVAKAGAAPSKKSAKRKAPKVSIKKSLV
jgi:hypothetical protein